MSKRNTCVVLLTITLIMPYAAQAGVIFGTDGDLGGGYRWDADYYEFNGLERSLDGDLRYSLEGGSVEAFRDSFVWDMVPTIGVFGLAIELAFAAWESIDPDSGLGTALGFVDDTANTAAVGNGIGTINILGSEIDLLASDAGFGGMYGTGYFQVSDNEMTLTSGTEDYAVGSIIGADINLNNNANTVWSLDWFRRVLTHEIGHALGMGDIDASAYLGFIDDNYDPNDPVGTLTNSWASLVNVYDPSASLGLTQYAGLTGSEFSTAGVDILMESYGVGVGPTNPLSNLVPLTADDYGTRQFLYPFIKPTSVPEPSSLSLFVFGLALLGIARIRRRELDPEDKCYAL